jgi:N-acetyl-anhydromuramyl-L-alanine amidase AmpD
VTTVTALLTNMAYGYPTRGARRRRKPTILACLHQTANARATAIQERTYANGTGSFGPSATAYIDRDGTVVRAIDPLKYAAWSQGDVAHPNTRLPTIAAAGASGVNMNEWVHESIECSGAGTEPFTDAQFESTARLVAAASRALGIPINRSTVVVHADINSVSRRSDPWPPATREARVRRVIARANAILRPPMVTATEKTGDIVRVT